VFPFPVDVTTWVMSFVPASVIGFATEAVDGTTTVTLLLVASDWIDTPVGVLLTIASTSAALVVKPATPQPALVGLVTASS
jgi:type IV secretory pathway TrbD component